MKFYIYTGLIYIGGTLYGIGFADENAVLVFAGMITALIGILLLTYLFEHIKD